jgi:hypothetical protein
VGSNVLDLACFHALHLGAHDAAHHPQIPVLEPQRTISPRFRDRVELVPGDRVHDLTRPQNALESVAPA